MKKTILATALTLSMGVNVAAEANTAGLTGTWSGLYSFDMTDPDGGVVPDTPALQAWTWDFDAGTISISNDIYNFMDKWIAHDVTFADNGTSYGPAGGSGAVNLLWDWSINLDIPITSDWDVTATGNSISDTAVVLVNYATITANSTAFPGFHPAFTGTLHKDSNAVPVPAAAWLMGSGLIGLIGLARRKKS